MNDVPRSVLEQKIDRKYDYQVAMAIDLVAPTVLERYLEEIEYEYYLTRQYFGLPKKGLLDANNFKQFDTK